MYSFHILFIYILFFTLKNVKSRIENVKIWENNTIYKKIQFNSNDVKILSFTSDDESGAELYFVEKKENYYFYFGNGNDNNFIQIKEENKKLIEFQSPLFEFNSNYYFCTSQNIMYFNGSSIIELENPSQLNNLNYSLKCLRGPNKSIVVTFLNTKYLSFFNLSDQKENAIYEQEFGDYLAINNYIQRDGSDTFRLTAIIRKADSNYYLATLKRDNNNFLIEQKTDTFIKDMVLFSSVELVTYYKNGEIFSFIFTYVSNSDNFHIYSHDLKKNILFEFRFLYIFKNFKITFAKYFKDSCILYYSITSMIPDSNQNYKSYIGVVDTEYNLGLYNIESDYKGKLYFNFGSKDKKDINLIYFINDTKVSTCPFINQNNACINEFESNKFVVSKNNNGFYYNYFSKECPDSYKDFGNYCFENCTDGYYNDNNTQNNNCTLCGNDNRLFFYVSKECLDPRNCWENHYHNDLSTCYDCEKKNKTFYNNDCIDNCSEIFAEEGANSSDCIICKEKEPKNKYFFSLKEHKCTLCEKGVKDYSKYLCTECQYTDNKKFYLKDYDKCVESCENYYSINDDGVCLFCDGNKNEFYFQIKDNESKCVHDYECDKEQGYGFEEIVLEELNMTLNICTKCIENKTKSGKVFIQDDRCVKTCGEGGIYKKWGINNKCIDCKEGTYFFEYTQDCTNNCPRVTKKNNDTRTCEFCPEGNVYYEEGNVCIQDCWNNQTKSSLNFDNKKILFVKEIRQLLIVNVLIAQANTIILLKILVINAFVGVKIIKNMNAMIKLENVFALRNIMDIVVNFILKKVMIK